MGDRNVETGGTKPGTDLHQAAGVAGDHEIECRAGAAQRAHLVREDCAGHLWLKQRKNAGAPAAAIGAREEPDVELRNRFQHCERSRMHSLGVLQMTGSVVSNLDPEPHTRSRTLLRQQLGNVTHLGTELPGGVSAEQVSVVLEQRSTPRAVYHDV